MLKPVEPARFRKTLERIRKTDGAAQPLKALDIPELTQIPCFVGNRIRLIRLDDVEYVYSDTTGVHVVTDEGESYTDMTLKVLEQKTDLVPCHRQSLVRLEKVSGDPPAGQRPGRDSHGQRPRGSGQPALPAGIEGTLRPRVIRKPDMFSPRTQGSGGLFIGHPSGIG